MAKFNAVKDSGVRQTFDTGSVRDIQEGKGRFDLITPIGLKRLAQHYENGAKKYGPRNWEKGQPLSRYCDSALRHMNCLLEVMKDEDHAAAVCWNIMEYIHTEEMINRRQLPSTLNDMPTLIRKEEEES